MRFQAAKQLRVLSERVTAPSGVLLTTTMRPESASVGGSSTRLSLKMIVSAELFFTNLVPLENSSSMGSRKL